MPDPITQLNAALEGRYHIDRKLGEGGMATVYLADDLRHERKVALKVLKPELAAVVGGDRFLTEIKTTANLQHPHILPLFDSGEADGFLFFVMPYIEGETLRDRLDRERQLPVSEALGIATAIAGALQVAHDHGIIHRDIKPGNILMSRDQPLVADFGIALAVGAAGGNRLTETGLSVGTPYYMSPEQATGDQAVGPASDTFALACVLYEMLVGEPPYPGSTAQAVLGKIIQGVPVSATSARKSIPLNVDSAIRKALEKLPADRFTEVRHFAQALGDPNFRHGESAEEAGAAVSRVWKGVAIASSAAALLLAGGLAMALRPPPPPPVERFSLLPAEGQVPDYEFDISDDGTTTVFGAIEGDVWRLVVRRLGDLGPTPVPGTEQGFNPAISPDGSEVAFVASGQLKVAPLIGGVIRTLADSVACCTRWGRDGYVYYSNNRRTMARVPVAGGPTEPATEYLEEGDGLHGDFEVIPGEDVAVFTVWGAPARVEAIRISTGERKVVAPGVKPFVTSEGHLIFGSLEGQILAGNFDPESMSLQGPAVPLVEGVRVDNDDWPYFSVARDGTLLYWSGISSAGTDGRVVRVDRSGNANPVDPSWAFDPGSPEVALALSPDGRRLAVKVSSETGDDIWVKQLDDGPLSRLTFDPAADWRPRWSADGQWIYFSSWRQDEIDLYRKRSDGTGSAELVLDLDGHVAEALLTPDEEWFILRLGGSTGGVDNRDLIGLRQGETETVPLAAEPYDEKAATLSPDGRWLAYESTETGRNEIYVRPFPEVNGGKWQVSSRGALNPLWANSGREIFYVAQGEMVAAQIDTSNGFEVTSRDVLFDLDELGIFRGANYTGWDVANDDQSFLMVQFGRDDQGDRPNEFILVQNWLEEVRARLPD
jgi:serine/threonine-protein kinase